MARKPKVFAWSDGFRRYLVAATSRARALEAWGFNRDLFREGAAREVQDGAGYDEALAEPGAVIELDVSAAVANAKVARQPPPSRPRKHVEPKPDRAAEARREKARAKVAGLEARLERIEADERQALDDIERRQRDLEEEAEAARDRYRAAVRKLKTELGKARRAL
jgi:hypothetical protein